MEWTTLKQSFWNDPVCHKFNFWKHHILMCSCTHKFVETPSVARRQNSQSIVYIIGRTIQGLISGRDKEVFSSAKHSDHHCSPPSLLMNRVARVLCLWAEHPNCEANPSFAFDFEVKKQWSYTSTCPISLRCIKGTRLPQLSVLSSETLHVPSLKVHCISDLSMKMYS